MPTGLPGRSRSEPIIPSLDATRATLIAVQSLAADALVRAPLSVILVRPFGPLDDWSLAVLAEILFSIEDQMMDRTGILKGQRRRLLERAWAALEEQALDSPTTSPLPWYQDIFFDVAQEYRVKGDRRAIEVLKRGLAHNLHYHAGNDVDSLLRDLAETHLWLGDLDQGLEILTALLRNDPADIWTYNLVAITFDDFGLADVGMEAALRALEVLSTTGDPEGLHDQLLRQFVSVTDHCDFTSNPNVLGPSLSIFSGSSQVGLSCYFYNGIGASWL